MDIKDAIKMNWARLQENSSAGFLLRLGWFIVLYYIAGQLFLIGTAFLIEFSIKGAIHYPFLWAIFNLSIKFLKLIYSNLLPNQDFMVIIDNQQIIQLFSGCSGLDPLFRITIILLLYPLPWKTKSLLLPLSWLIIFFAASIHFILLIPVAYHWPDWYSFSHDWLTKIIFYGFYFLTWLLWEKVGFRKKTEL